MQVGDRVRVIKDEGDLQRILLSINFLERQNPNFFINEYEIARIDPNGEIRFITPEHIWFREFNLELVAPAISSTVPLAAGDKVRILDNRELLESVDIDYAIFCRQHSDAFTREYTVRRIAPANGTMPYDRIYFTEMNYHVKPESVIKVISEPSAESSIELLALKVGMKIRVIDNEEDLNEISIQYNTTNFPIGYFDRIRIITGIDSGGWYNVTRDSSEQQWTFKRKNLQIVEENMKKGDFVKIRVSAEAIYQNGVKTSKLISHNGSRFYSKKYEIIEYINKNSVRLNDTSDYIFSESQLELLEAGKPKEEDLPRSYKELSLEKANNIVANKFHTEYWDEIQKDIRKYYDYKKNRDLVSTELFKEFREYLYSLFDGTEGHNARTVTDIKNYCLRLLQHKEKLDEWEKILNDYCKIIVRINPFIKKGCIKDLQGKNALYQHRSSLLLFDNTPRNKELLKELLEVTNLICLRIGTLQDLFAAREKADSLLPLIKEIEVFSSKIQSIITNLDENHINDRKKLLLLRNQKEIQQQLQNLQGSKKKPNLELQQIIDDLDSPVRAEDLVQMYKNIKEFLFIKNEKDAKTHTTDSVREVEGGSTNSEADIFF